VLALLALQLLLLPFVLLVGLVRFQTWQYDTIDEDPTNTHMMDVDRFLKDTRFLFDLWTIIILNDNAVALFGADNDIKQDG
jgi:hypothetical protein